METAAAVDNISDLQVLPTAAWKSPAGFPHSFHRPGGGQPNKPKPDRSLATKTGHFYLLPTLITVRNNSNLNRLVSIFTNMNRLATVFEVLDEIRVLPRPLLDIFPGEHFVVSRSNTIQVNTT